MVTLLIPVRLIGFVMIRVIPAACGVGLSINSLASPPALLLSEMTQLAAPVSVTVHPSGNDAESNVSLK